MSRTAQPFVCLLALSACAPDLTEPCPTSDQPALRITVRSIAGDVCNAVVLATPVDQPSLTETLVVNNCVYTGATERPGAYKVSISAPGFQTRTIWPTAGEDDCGHVKPRAVIVLLMPDGEIPTG